MLGRHDLAVFRIAKNAKNPGRLVRYVLLSFQVGFFFALSLFSVLNIQAQSRTTKASDSTDLYNGIQLPTPWPPELKELTRDPLPVPYLLTPPAVIPIDVGRQLFVDDFLIQKSTLKRTFHLPEPYAGNPILAPDRVWEMGNHNPMAAPFSDGVWYDSKDHQYKMWYLCSQQLQEKSGFATCYATSFDGLHWEKPLLDVVPGTNIVLTALRDSTVVWRDDHDADSTRRFKLFLSPPDAESAQGDSVRYSPDGIHWSEPAASNHNRNWSGDRTTVFYNPFRGVWVYSIRNHFAIPGLGRIRYYSESPNLAAGLEEWKPLLWTAADRLDLHNPKFLEIEPQFYNVDAVAYESLMVGLFSVWEGPENKVCAKLHIQKRNQVMLGFSRDGFHWERPDRRPFLAVNETEGAWNWGNMQSAGGGFLVVGDRLYFYSSGRRRNDQNWDGNSSTGVFMLRRDGFASLDADAHRGSVTTRAVVFKGRRLFVNFSTRHGELRTEVLDEAGRPIAPFTLADNVPLRMDGTKQMIRWKCGDDLYALAGHRVRFRFTVKKGSLYSFWVSSSNSGASMGYTAAGGPGISGDRDTDETPIL